MQSGTKDLELHRHLRRSLRWPACTPLALKRKYRPFDEIFITGCIERWHFALTCFAGSDGHSIQTTFPFDPSVKNGLVPPVWYQTLVTTASCFRAAMIPHWDIDRLIHFSNSKGTKRITCLKIMLLKGAAPFDNKKITRKLIFPEHQKCCPSFNLMWASLPPFPTISVCFHGDFTYWVSYETRSISLLFLVPRPFPIWLRNAGRFNYEGLVPHKQYFAGTLSGMSSCVSYVLTHSWRHRWRHQVTVVKFWN